MLSNPTSRGVLYASAAVVLASAALAFLSPPDEIPDYQDVGMRHVQFLPCYGHVLPNNLRLVCLIMLGSATAGMTSLVGLIAAGSSLGVAAGIASAGQAPIIWTGSAILPHGLPEMVGFCAAAVAAWHGFRGLWSLVTQRSVGPAGPAFWTWTLASILLVVAAASVECGVSPWLMALASER